jgi:L,D-peptidoglycan transpeptidase YkuD (ErfK/YbiS/YcfS/YnhG family)
MATIRVRTAPSGPTIDWGAGARRCAVGRSGIGLKQREGDGFTPTGRWPIRNVLFRADRIARLNTALATRIIMMQDGWCDAPGDTNYNKPIALPYDASHEKLWRQDRFYDIVVVLGFNDAPVVAGKGSAIFLHVAREGYAPTEGCVALALPDLIELVENVSPDSLVDIAL